MATAPKSPSNSRAKTTAKAAAKPATSNAPASSVPDAATAADAATHASVRDYYGKVLTSKADLRTTACCAIGDVADRLKPLLANVHPEILDTFYGCGTPLPSALEGATVLDLGCGSGRDCYVLSQLVGPQGKVIGLDMTEEQLTIARRHRSWHAKRFGHSNVTFIQGYIEDLATAGIADASVDVVVSNCVINLSPDKARVFSEIFRVLKPGGELYIADVYADRRLPDALRRDPVLLGECLGGAMYVEDFRRVLADLDCHDFRVVDRRAMEVTEPELEAKLGNAQFESITVRAFKLPLEDRCEDYGQVAWYLGTVPGLPHGFGLDDHHYFETGRPVLICGNTADMLGATRFAPHFRIAGDKSFHLGIFDDCGTNGSGGESASPCDDEGCDLDHEHDHAPIQAPAARKGSCGTGACC